MSAAARLRGFGLLIAALVFVVDQWSKHYVTAVMGLREIGDYHEILPFFDLRFTRNFGVSLGMFEATSPEMRWMLVAVTALIAAVVTVWMMREKLMTDIAALALILGGALGNIRDRAELGYVVDFADLHFGDFRPFLIFNIADAAITVGVLIILARAFFLRDKADQIMTTTPAKAAETEQ